MKNFTNNFKQFTSRLSARWLIMALMLLVGTSSAWADGFFEGLKVGYYTASTGNVYTGYGTSTLNELKGDLYLKLLAVKTYDSGVTSVTIEVKEGNTVLISRSNANFKSSWSDNWNKEWELVTDTKLPSTLGTHNISVIAKTNNSTSVTYSLTYTIISDDPCPDGVIYRVAGNYSEITSNDNWCNGKKWDPSANENKMTCNEGIYTITYNNLPANTGDQQYAFKVVKNEDWGTAYPSSNYTFKLTEASNVTITFDPSTGNVSHKTEVACTKPSKPTLSNTSGTTCPNVDYLLPTARNIGNYTQKWYDSNGKELTSTTVNVSTETTYTTKLIDGTCESAATDFTLSVTQAPSAPSISIGSEKICNGEKTFILVDSPLANHIYKLFKDGNEVANATLNNENKFIISEAGSYTVKVTAPQTACGLTSDPSQAKTLTVTSVTLELDPTSAPICSGKTIADIANYVKATATVTPSEEANVNWYASENEPTALPVDTRLSATTYYAEAVTTSGCKSGRKSFTITSLMTAPSAPVIKSNKYAVCSGESVELTLEYKRVGETYTINNDTPVFTKSTTWTSPALNSKTDYIVTATNSCGSTDSEKLTINVTTTPVISGVTVTTPDKPVELISSVENTVWSCSGGSLSSSEGKTVTFTASSTEEYIITAKNKENENCSASVTVYVRESLYYIYIRRPKNGETDKNYDAYGYWYEFSNNDQKGGASWFKEGEAGSGIGTNDEAKDPNYGGYAPEFSFEDCNDYIWDAFAPANLTTNYKFHVHAPNGSDSKGHATFTQTTTISSMTSDLYYKIMKWDDKSQGVVLTQVTGNNIPTPRPEVATPIISMEPIICFGTNAIVEITNPQNGVTYTLTYNGEKQGDPISYNGSNEVKFSVNQAGTYMVSAETTEGTCKGSATSRGENLQIITTSVSFSQSEYITTPWIPVTVKINVPKGYSYTYTDTEITGITPAENAPIRKANGTEITYTFPRPNAEGTVDPWGIGNTTGDGWGVKEYQVQATITGAPDACSSAKARVKLQDEGNDKCTTTNP